MRKAVCLLLVLALSVFSFTFKSMPVKAELKTIIVPDDYPTIMATAFAAVIALVGVSLLVYFKKRKR